MNLAARRWLASMRRPTPSSELVVFLFPPGRLGGSAGSDGHPCHASIRTLEELTIRELGARRGPNRVVRCNLRVGLEAHSEPRSRTDTDG